MHHRIMPAQSVNLSIRGMTCDNCARGVQRALSATPGVSRVAVSLESAGATVDYDPALVTPADLAAAVRKLGYQASA